VFRSYILLIILEKCFVLLSAVLNDWAMSEITEQYLKNEETDDFCRLKYSEIVTLTTDTDGPCTTESVSGDWSAEDKQGSLLVVKQEPDDVCYIVW